MGDETAWVIVRGSAPLSYFTGFKDNWHTAWSKRHEDAQRFATKNEALQRLGDGRSFGDGAFSGARVQEHMWCDRSTPALPETAPMTDDRAEPREWLRKTDDELVAQADKIIGEMCNGGKWRMCIPVQPDDSDVILGTLVRRFNELRAATVSAGRLREAAQPVHGVTWLLIRDWHVALERCPKKAAVLGVGEWFVPGGKIEGDESPEACCQRELREEWPGVEVLTMHPLPIVEGSAVPPGPRGLFLMRPFVVTVRGDLPTYSGDGVRLRWVTIAEALASPVPQVRMMVAAALSAEEG
jgi:ADP-ribose pyrophosphatase YjhB (NUDIX family)